MADNIINSKLEHVNQELPTELQPIVHKKPNNKYGGLKGNRKERRRQLAIVKRAIRKGLVK